MRRLLIAASALVLSGCALQPTFIRPAAPVAPTYPTGAAYKDVGGAQAPAVDIGWRDFITDARLQRLVEIALRNNRDLRVSALNIAEAEATHRIQRAALFPAIDAAATGTTKKSTVSGRRSTSHTYTADVGASWEVDFFGRVRSLRDQALYQYFATAQAAKATYILLVSEVADQYLTMLAADELLAVTSRTLATAQESYDLARVKFDAGVGTELSVRQAESTVEAVRANYAAQLRSRAQAENALVVLVGQPLPADLPPGVLFNAQAFLADIPAGMPSDLLMRRPDIMEAEANLRAANAYIGAARAKFFPTIDLTGTYGSTSAALSNLFGAGTGFWAFAPSITLPLFDAGSRRASLDVAWIQKESAVAQYEKSIQTAFKEVANGLAARGTYDDQIAALEREVAAERVSLELSELRFRTGVDSYLSVLTAQTSLYTAEQTLVSARLNRLTNLVDLYRVLGGGWIERSGDTPRPAEDLALQARAPTQNAADSQPSFLRRIAGWWSERRGQ